ncbi:hypothetical protein [Meridianimarinicoccus sp. MJW13]|uniref:hypothetical protein n=1 Tax=Meridianimarinicoccus sp. MJW13 TaxID=2720031 RepID=UPI001865B6EC|nr:hypothetical protein [Fluviibacterium sp. MJW13]
MKTTILIGTCAVFLLGTAEMSVGQQADSPATSVEKNAPNSIACSQERGEVLGECSYRLDRDEKGKTTVTVIFANGFTRRLFFEDGKFLKASVTMSGVGTNGDWSLESGTHMIQVDGQQYQVPDTLVTGN